MCVSWWRRLSSEVRGRYFCCEHLYVLTGVSEQFDSRRFGNSHEDAECFAKVKRPEPPAIFSEKYTNEQMPDLLKMIPENRFYKAFIHKLRYESRKKPK